MAVACFGAIYGLARCMRVTFCDALDIHVFIFFQIIGFLTCMFSTGLLLAFSFWLSCQQPMANSQKPT